MNAIFILCIYKYYVSFNINEICEKYKIAKNSIENRKYFKYAENNKLKF